MISPIGNSEEPLLKKGVKKMRVKRGGAEFTFWSNVYFEEVKKETKKGKKKIADLDGIPEWLSELVFKPHQHQHSIVLPCPASPAAHHASLSDNSRECFLPTIPYVHCISSHLGINPTFLFYFAFFYFSDDVSS